MLIKINDLQIINWTNQHLEINILKATSGCTLDLVNLDGSKIELKRYKSLDMALDEMEYLATTKAFSDKTPLIKITLSENNG